MASTIPSHAAAWTPEDEHCVLAPVEQFLSAPEHPLQAGVSHNTETRAPSYIQVMPCAGSVVHSNDAVRVIDFLAPIAASQVARAGHQGARPAMHLQRLQGINRKEMNKSRIALTFK